MIISFWNRRFVFTSLFGVFVIAWLQLSANAVQLRAEEEQKSPPLPFVEGSWTLVLLPDTQYYSAKHPDLFKAQTEWIVKHKDERNIEYVLHLGDITDNGKAKQWRPAHRAMSILDGKVPYALAVGNHDYISSSGGAATTRETLINTYFSVENCKKWPTFGGMMKEGEIQNTYHIFSAGHRDWIVLALEWAPRDETIAWANEVLDKYPERRAILLTHAYLWRDGTRLDFAKGKAQGANPHEYKTPGNINDGEELWNKLVKKHDFAFVFCGHIAVNDSPILSSKNEKGTTTHQILSDFQDRKLGGEAYLTILEFLPDNKTVQLKNYSPYYDKYLTEPKQQYTLKLE